jgi:ABC-type transport system involved in cytochrome bd biosynthesis fused ATPase/permease subunit
LLLKFSGITKLPHFLLIILEIFPKVFLLYGENKSKNLINSSNSIFGSLSFFISQIKQLLTFGAGEKAFAGTVLRY